MLVVCLVTASAALIILLNLCGVSDAAIIPIDHAVGFKKENF